VRVAVAQQNPTVGAIEDNAARIAAVSSDADLVVFPELSVCGYPPRDLLDRRRFIERVLNANLHLAHTVRGPAVIGTVTEDDGRLFNTAMLLWDGKVWIHRKNLLPNYDVFDEARYFGAGNETSVVPLPGARVLLSVCEDAWNDKTYWRTPRYTTDPIHAGVSQGADVIVNISASPFAAGKPEERHRMLQRMARRHGLPVVYVNQVGGNDSLIFDGRSMVLDGRGELLAQAPPFAEALLDVALSGPAIAFIAPERSADIRAALVLGVRDYVHKCGFTHAVVGLSGGIDSAVTCAIAVEALGAPHVHGVAMPSRYSSEGSVTDALQLAENLHVRCEVVGIDAIHHAYEQALGQAWQREVAGLAGENLQARIRGAMLMAYANDRPGTLLLTTGNKSELAVGYCTLYGDMCGGLAVLSDVYKTEVYALARTYGAVIPAASVTKPPSAELRPGQQDTDSLPPYEILDAILRDQVDGAGDTEQTPLQRRIRRMLHATEYKRRQMPPGLRVSGKAFGEGRRLPIAAWLPPT
jgi:NAD+ synthetase